MSRASTRACAMNCSMAKSSTRCVRHRSSSKVGGATSTFRLHPLKGDRAGFWSLTVQANLDYH